LSPRASEPKRGSHRHGSRPLSGPGFRLPCRGTHRRGSSPPDPIECGMGLRGRPHVAAIAAAGSNDARGGTHRPVGITATIAIGTAPVAAPTGPHRAPAVASPDIARAGVGSNPSRSKPARRELARARLGSASGRPRPGSSHALRLANFRNWRASLSLDRARWSSPD
jgi:hypothetical protein